jgi:two-component system response regulator ArlR
VNGGEYVICIDDDPVVARILERVTACSVVSFSSVAGFRAQAQRYHPSAVFLDIHLSEESGIELIPEIRESWPRCPILVITSDESSDWVGRALAAGAQDFLRKPLHPEEVRARLCIRKEEARLLGDAHEVSLGNTLFDRQNRILSCGKERIFLPELEAKLFGVLVDNQRTLCARELLVSGVWPGVAVSDNALEQRIASIRKSLVRVASNVRIKTVRGKGYLLEVASGFDLFDVR